MFFARAFTVLLAFATSLVANVSAIPAPVNDGVVMTESQLLTWLSKQDPAELTYIGAPVGGPRALTDVTVVYCSRRVGGVCGGPCTVYTGGSTCLNAPDTNCLSATANVGFCDRAGCGGSCHDYNTCGVRLDNGFCFTPGTRAILVPFI